MSSSSSADDNEIRLNVVEGCYENPPPGFTPFNVECIPTQDLSPGDILPGGRTVLVTPYVKGISVCSGQYAQFQVLNGLGGQIDRGLYLGSSVGRVADSIKHHGIEVPVDCDDTMDGPTEINGGSDGDKGIAIRDRGRWYVVKLAQGGGTSVLQVEVYGGNKNPYDGDTMDTYKVAPYRPFVFPRFKEAGLLDEHDLTEDWYGLDTLPDTFTYGDEFEEDDDHTLPYGFGWAKLARGMSVGQYSWDAAAYEQHYVSEDDPDNAPSLTVAFAGPDTDDDKIIVCFSEPISETATPDVDDYAITTTSETDISISSVDIGSPESSTLTLTLDRDIVYDDEVIRVSIPASAVKDADDEENSAGNLTVRYKLEKFSLVPVVNKSDTVLIRGQTAFITETKSSYTINDEEREWYDMFAEGERPKFSLEVVGGNALDYAVTSFPNAIKQLLEDAEPSDWQDFNLTSIPGISEDLEPDDLPESTNGYGFGIGFAAGELFADASTWEGRIEILRNKHVGKAVINGDVLLMIDVRMVSDSKEEQEYRAVWEIFA